MRPLPYHGICPVCRTLIQPQIRLGRAGRSVLIGPHVDSMRIDMCPAWGEPWRITLPVPAERQAS